MKLSRRDLVKGVSVAAMIAVAPHLAEAAFHGSIGAPLGKSVLNGFQEPDFPFKNLFLMATSGVSPGGFQDANGYPVNSSFSHGNLIGRLPPNYYGRYRIAWQGTMALNSAGFPVTIYHNSGNYSSQSFQGSLAANDYVEFDFSSAITAISDSGVSNGAGGTLIQVTIAAVLNGAGSYVNMQISGAGGGANGTWVTNQLDTKNFTLIGSTFTSTAGAGGTSVFSYDQVSWAFSPSFVTFSGFSGLILCRSSAPYANDLADVQSGDLSRMFNQDFVNLWSAITPGIIRMLDVSGVNEGINTRSGYVTPVSYISYQSGRFLPNLWCGGNGAAGTIHDPGGASSQQYTCAAATDTPVSWTDGEIFQGILDGVPTTMAITGAVAGASNGAGGNYINLKVAATTLLSNGQRIAVTGYNNATSGYASLLGQGLWTIGNVVNGASTTFDLISNKAGLPSVFVTPYVSGGAVSIATVNCGSRGAKLLVNLYGLAPTFAGSYDTVNKVTCVYNATLDVVIISNAGAGINPCWPLEVRVALCNKLNAHYWHQFSHLYDLASVTAETNYIKNNLKSTSGAYFEFSNEMWNSGFNQGIQAFFYGGAYSSSSSVFGGSDWVALQHRRFMGAVTTAWGARSGLNRVLPWQAANFSGSVTSQLYNGASLNGTTFPLYAAAGFSNYDGSGGSLRPIDVTESLSYAPYYQGALVGPHGLSGTLNALDLAGMTTAADNYATGTAPNIAAAFAWCDNDIRQGTTSTIAISSVSSGTTFNATAHGFSNTNIMAFSLASGGSFYSAGVPSINQLYYIVNATANTFQLSLTSGGAAITGITGGSNVQIGLLRGATLLYENTFYYPPYSTAALSYSPAKKVACYESGYQGGPAVTTAQCTAYGIASKYGGTDTGTLGSGGTVYNMIKAYKESALFKATVLKQWADQQAVHVVAGGLASDLKPAWYTSSGAAGTVSGTVGTTFAANYPWAMIETTLYGSPQTFQSYNAMQQFNQT